MRVSAALRHRCEHGKRRGARSTVATSRLTSDAAAVPATPVRPQDSDARFGLHGILAFIAVFLVAVPFGILVLLLRQKASWLRHLDLDTASTLHTYDERHPTFVTVMRVVTNLGASLTWIVVLTLVGVWLLYRRLYRLASFLAVTAIGSSLLNEAIKAAVGRTRPVLVNPIATATGKSFPSGHTQAATVGYGILLLIFIPVLSRGWRKLVAAAATIVVLLVGFSRVALGVHYLSDVVGALIIGTAWLLAMTAAFSVWRQDRHLPQVHPTEGLEPEQADRLTPDR
jgi:membrane-associated phospholipid phosphatase